jgi:hypothetical protein
MNGRPIIGTLRRWGASGITFVAVLGFALCADAETRLEGQIRHDQIWNAAQSPYRIAGVLSVDKGATVTMGPGVVVRFEKGSRFDVKGTLMADYAVFDGLEDIYNHEKLLFHPGSRGRLSHCAAQNLSLEIRTSEALITGSVISNRNGSGITVGKMSRPAIFHNDFTHNSYYAVYKEGQDTLRVPNNYWGAADGPSGTGPGKGDAVNAAVDFRPYASADMGEHLILLERDLDHTTVQPGENLTLTYVIANLNSFDHDVILGASIYSDPAHHIHSPAHDLAVTIKPGCYRLTRAFTIPKDAAPGHYTLLWGVMKSDLSAYDVLQEDPNRLNISTTATVSPPATVSSPAAKSPGWVPLKRSLPY